MSKLRPGEWQECMLRESHELKIIEMIEKWTTARS